MGRFEAFFNEAPPKKVSKKHTWVGLGWLGGCGGAFSDQIDWQAREGIQHIV